MAFVLSPGVAPRRFSVSVSPQKNTRFVLANARQPARMSVQEKAIEKGGGMKVIKAADENVIAELGCRSWDKWGCEPSTFDWTYSDDEICLVLEGDFTVKPADGSDSMDVQAGDIAFFPKGMSCVWEVRKAVDKHFLFGKSL
ncbi:unnamed protein product [Chondrus crispus]|uniref:(S)-ureidoglycine aminohydrolase cupin domain-containing protein n=1 Tax=Chondrus crispus TaxID=2769 RepID=R7Q4G6_CHOCR|nr:unnamed protein product [Chondrus crispus]CDF32763.1 unnamed protein product [Chondrus crispus]|eukprot:XP_005712564.1 unnamed protein product [Chondrus crispus]